MPTYRYQISKKHRGGGQRLRLLLALRNKELEQQLRDIRKILESLQKLVRAAPVSPVDREIFQGHIQHNTRKGPGKVRVYADLLSQIMSGSEVPEQTSFITRSNTLRPKENDASSIILLLRDDSTFDEYTSAVGSRPSVQSYSEHVLQYLQKKYPRPSFVGHDESDVEYVDSRGLAMEIIRGLQFGFGTWPIPCSGLAITDDNLSSKLREILESYCAEILSTDQPDAPMSQLTQNPLHLKGHSMVLKEIQFLVKELVSIFEGGIRILIVKSPRGNRARARDAGEDTLPISVARDFLMIGKAFGRLKLRIRRLVKQDIMRIISDEVLLDLPPTATGLTTATFHVRWELFDHILNEQDGSTDISQTLTVTGEARDAYASRCVDYLKWLWKDSKYDICSHIQQYLEKKSYSKSLFFRGHRILSIY